MPIVMMNGREYGGTGITATSIGYYDAMNIGANNVQDAITQLCAESRKDIASCKSNITSLTQRVEVIENTLANAYNHANSAYNKANTAWNLANTANAQANTAYNKANTAWNLANTANAQANTAYNKANTAYTYADGAYTLINNKLPYNIVRKTQSQYNELVNKNKVDPNTFYFIPI